MKTGRCACGAVRYTAEGELTGVTFCHCSKCRRWHGHVGAYTAVLREGFRLEEDRGLRWHPMNDRVRRGFCGECGSSLFWDEDGDPRMSICAGTLDAPTDLRARAHIFVGSKGDYYPLPDDGLARHDEYS